VSTAGRESAPSARFRAPTLQGEVASAAPTMASSFRPEPRYCWRIAAIGGWRGPGHKKSIVMAELKPDQEMIVAEASYPLHGARTIRRPAGGAVSSSRYTNRQVENFAEWIDSRSGDPNMQVISTRGARALITTSTSKA
jgi:hypothetical protein